MCVIEEIRTIIGRFVHDRGKMSLFVSESLPFIEPALFGGLWSSQPLINMFIN